MEHNSTEEVDPSAGRGLCWQTQRHGGAAHNINKGWYRYILNIYAEMRAVCSREERRVGLFCCQMEWQFKRAGVRGWSKTKWNQGEVTHLPGGKLLYVQKDWVYWHTNGKMHFISRIWWWEHWLLSLRLWGQVASASPKLHLNNKSNVMSAKMRIEVMIHATGSCFNSGDALCDQRVQD